MGAITSVHLTARRSYIAWFAGHVFGARSQPVTAHCMARQLSLSRRGRLTLEALQAVWAGQPPRWVETLAAVPMAVPQELLDAAWQPRARAGAAHPLAHRRLSVADIRARASAAASDGAGRGEAAPEPSGRQWWSGGECLYSPDAHCSAFFECVFQTIRDAPVVSAERIDGSRAGSYAHALSHMDLFHGHVFTVHPAYTARVAPSSRGGADWRQHGQAEVGIVFHAKEYPSDLVRTPHREGGSGYDSTHPAYRSRNLVWLASTNSIYVWRPPLYPSRWEGLLQLGTEWDEMSAELQQTLTAESYRTDNDDDSVGHIGRKDKENLAPAAMVAPHRRAYTLSEGGFRELATITDVAANDFSTTRNAPEGAVVVTSGGADSDHWSPWECDVNLLLQPPSLAADGDDSACNRTLVCRPREPAAVSAVMFAWTAAQAKSCPHQPGESQGDTAGAERRSRL